MAWTAADQSARQARRQAWRDDNKCGKCGGERRDGFTTCLNCRTGAQRTHAAKRIALVELLALGATSAACVGCGVVLVLRQLEADHIVPQSAGGDDGIENRQLLCRACNIAKGNRSMDYLFGHVAAERANAEAWQMLQCVDCGDWNMARCLSSARRCILCSVARGKR